MSGKTALVTGAAAGIGAAIARKYCEQGARVWLLDKDERSLRQATEELRSQYAGATMCVADITRLDQVEEVVAAIHQQVGCLDVLVNNAGVDTRGSFLNMTEAEWLGMLDVNLNGAYRCTRLVVPPMVKRRAGKVIHISSVTFHWGLKHLTHYISAKGGLVGFTRALARELGEFNIHVNCITPGAILTERESRTVSPEQAASVIQLQSLQRRILPEDIARTCVFLGTEWSDGLTGQTINVDGGWVMH
jgi:3-oxoacyl-[acyl-carrier protein] reductase